MAVHMAFLSVNAVGAGVTSSASSQFVALPVTAAGTKPKFVRVQANGFAYIKFGPTGTIATTNDFYISANNAEIFAVGDFDFMAYLQDTAAAKIVITPLEA